MSKRVIESPLDCGRRKKHWHTEFEKNFDMQKRLGCLHPKTHLFMPCPSPDRFPEGCPLEALTYGQLQDQFKHDLEELGGLFNAAPKRVTRAMAARLRAYESIRSRKGPKLYPLRDQQGRFKRSGAYDTTPHGTAVKEGRMKKRKPVLAWCIKDDCGLDFGTISGSKMEVLERYATALGDCDRIVRVRVEEVPDER